MTPDEQRDLIKEAIKEWMTEQQAALGWWTLKTIAVIAVTTLLAFWFSRQGVKFPP